ncbi:kinocilin isoform 2-T2 [Clarias gariepinus]
MNAVSIGEYHGLRVGSALLSIVSGCIIIGVSKDCDADAVGGIFLGAGGLGLLISVYPFIKAWFNIHHILPNIGNFRVHPVAPTPAPEQPPDSLRREDPPQMSRIFWAGVKPNSQTWTFHKHLKLSTLTVKITKSF